MDYWLIFPILASFLFSTVNYLDKFLIEKLAINKGLGSLVIFSALAGMPIVLILTIFLREEAFNITKTNAILIVLAGVSYLIGIVFYLHSIWDEEVSNVIPQMLLMPFITILLGYIFLGEELNIKQGLGGILVLIGSIILTYNFKTVKQARLKKYLYVIGTSLFIAINQTIFKYGIREDNSFWTNVYWEHIGFCLTAIIIFIFIPAYRREFLAILNKYGQFAVIINSTGEITTIAGNILLHYAAILAPVGLINLLAEGTQPFFLIGMGLLLTKYFPHIIQENIEKNSIIIKLIACTFMISGIYIIS